jgi:hypothetical protein
MGRSAKKTSKFTKKKVFAKLGDLALSSVLLFKVGVTTFMG